MGELNSRLLVLQTFNNNSNMKEEVLQSSTSTRIETAIAFEAAKNSLEATFLGGCGLMEKVEEEDRPAKNGKDQLASPHALCSLNSFKEVQELLKQEQERNALLETQISVLISDLRSYENLLAQVISGGSKKAMDSLQVLYKRTSSIEADQVAEDIDEAVDLEGRPQVNHLEREQSKKRKWRRTGAIKLSRDYRDVF